MQPSRDPLVRHLTVILAVKLAVLTALWWAFVRGEQVNVDVDDAKTHMGASNSGGVSDTRRASTHLSSTPSGARP